VSGRGVCVGPVPSVFMGRRRLWSCLCEIRCKLLNTYISCTSLHCKRQRNYLVAKKPKKTVAIYGWDFRREVRKGNYPAKQPYAEFPFPYKTIPHP
jgi:hypothetical protein